MDNIPAPASPADPIVFEREGRVFANSRDVSSYFGKQHAHVLRDIDNLLNDMPNPDLDRGMFVESVYEDANGQTRRCVNMTRDGFTILGMGFTGAKALGFKLRYMAQFNAMESALRNRAAGFAIPSTLSEALRLAADQAETIEKQKAQIQATTETVAAYDRIAGSSGNCTMTLAAKELKVPPHTFTKWCDTNGWTYRRGNQRLAFQDKINAGHLDMRTDTVQRPDGTDKAVYQVFVTPRGLARLAKIFTAAPPTAPPRPAINGTKHQPGAGI